MNVYFSNDWPSFNNLNLLGDSVSNNEKSVIDFLKCNKSDGFSYFSEEFNFKSKNENQLKQSSKKIVKVKNAWGNNKITENLINSYHSNNNNTNFQGRFVVGSQEPKVDRWDKVVKRYLKARNEDPLLEDPIHNWDYERNGKIAKQKLQSKGKKNDSKREWQIKVNNAIYHKISSLGILEEYNHIKMVKALYKDHPSLYSACCLERQSKKIFGVVEITFNEYPIKLNHKYFKQYENPEYIKIVHKKRNQLECGEELAADYSNLQHLISKNLENANDEILEIQDEDKKFIFIKDKANF